MHLVSVLTDYKTLEQAYKRADDQGSSGHVVVLASGDHIPLLRGRSVALGCLHRSEVFTEVTGRGVDEEALAVISLSHKNACGQ